VKAKSLKYKVYNKDLMLRSERSERLEAWATSAVRVATLRDAALRAAPQGEVN
jgi:hypothetical protein